MLSRSVSAALRAGQMIPRLAIARRALSSSSLRLNQVRPPAPGPQKTEHDKPKQTSSGPSAGVWAAAALLLAGGLWYGFSGEGKQPQESLDSIVSSKQDSKDNNTKPLDSSKISVIFVLGGPGAGKGTQCANLVKDYGFIHLSAGDLLRAEQKRQGSQYGQLIADYIKAGKIVPQQVTIGLLRNAISDAQKDGKSRFLIDGFPRKMDQAITFEEEVAPSDFTLFFECPEEVMLKRLLKRGESSGRADDNIESIKNRFRVFVDTSMPVVDYFDKSNKVVKVQCDHPPEQVYDAVKKALHSRGIN